MRRKLLFKKGLHQIFWSFALLLLLLPNDSIGQTFTGTYSFGTNGDVNSFSYNGTAITSLAVSPLTKVGVTTSSSSGNFRASDWDTGSTNGSAAGGSVNTGKYFQFTLTAQTGYTLSGMSFNFGFGRSATGPRLLQCRSSVDGYSSLLTASKNNVNVTINSNVFEIPDANSGYTGNTATSSASGVSAITFRIYIYGAEVSGGTGGLQGNLIFNGTLTAAVTAPVVSTDVIPSSIGTTTATLGGNVTNDGGDAVTARGLVYAATLTNNNPIIFGTGVTNSSTSGTTGAFSVSETSLSANTSYSYRAYATNSIGTGYGLAKSFYTYANAPTEPTVNSPTTSSLNVTIGTGDGNPFTTEYSIQDVGSGLYVQVNGSLGVVEVWQTASTWSTKTVTGLSSNTEYGFAVKARNGDGVETDFGSIGIENTLANASPTFESDLLADFGSVCLNADVINNFTFIGYNLDNSTVTVGPLSGYTFATSIGGTYGTTVTYTADSNGDVAETVFVKFTPTNIQSYDGPISISGGGAATITVGASGSGINTVAQITTGASSAITATTASATGMIVDGCSAIISSGIEYSVSNDYMVSVFVSGLPASLTGLEPNTQYFYRAVVTDATGTINGVAATFTTTKILAPVATAGSDIEQTQFTANWNSSAGASSYRLDVSASPTFGITTPTSNLFISEYGEGNTGNQKYIEIYNGTGASVDLSNYEIWKNVNGSNWNFQSNNTTPTLPISLSGTLVNGGTYVIANNATDVLGADLYSGSLTFNGDDATGLAWNGGSGNIFSLIDAVGQDGSDPGTGWSVAGVNNATANKILIRKPTVLAPNSDWTASAGTTVNNSEWIVSSFTYNNTSQTTDLGLHTIDNTSPSFVFGYEDLQVFGTSQVVTSLMASTNYYYRVRAESATSLSDNSNMITVMTSAAPPTFGTIIQSGDVACENTSVSFFITGLLPNSVSTLTYNINGGSDLTLTNVVANGSGLVQIVIVLQAINNGQTLAVTKVERTDIVSPELIVTENNSVLLQVSANQSWYLDTDNDGYGVAETTVIACVQPSGYVLLSGDCNDGNNAINPGVTEVCWNGIDDNCDTVQSEGCAPIVVNMATANNHVLPSFAIAVSAYPYAAYPGVNEYRFSIKNNNSGITQEVISPTRFVTIPSDMRDYNISYTIKASAVINGELVPYAGNTINVFSPVVGLVKLAPTSCGVTLASLTSNLSSTVGLNATSYIFRARLTSDNGPTPTYYTVQSASRFASMNSFIGLVPQYGASYTITVQYEFLDVVSGTVVQSGYGAECEVLMPGIPTIKMSSPTCGTTLTSMNATISASPALYALAYEFRIRLTSDNSPTPTYYYTLPNASRFSSMSAFQGLALQYSTSYTVSVRYKIMNNGSEVWSNYGAACVLTTPFFPTTEINPLQCGLASTALDQTINIVAYPGFPTYRLSLSEQVGEDFVPLTTITRTVSNFKMNMFAGVEAGKTYGITVSIFLNGVFGPEGKLCDITTPAAQRTVKVPFTAVAYPNPFANSFLLDVKTSYNTPLDIKVYDMLGRLVEQKQANVNELETTTIGERYPSGVYNVIVTQDEETSTLRVVKR